MLESKLIHGVRAGVFPGASGGAAWWQGDEVQSVSAQAGLLCAGGAAVDLQSEYDLASLTKPHLALVTLRLAESGALDPRLPVATWLPEISELPGGRASLNELLSHRAGLAAWSGFYARCPAAAGSERARRWFLEAVASGVDLDQVPGQSRYSDLGYMLAGLVLERATGCSLETLLQAEICVPLELEDGLGFPAAWTTRSEAWLSRVAPTERCNWRGRVCHGEVHDENCAALGGVSGHAGLFGSLRAVLRVGLETLRVLDGRSGWLRAQTLKKALAPHPGGGHVLGWDTVSPEGSSAGLRMSRDSYGHLGFTGTSLWCDPRRRLCIVLLSNRVHPSRANIAIRALRPEFHDAVVEAFDQHGGGGAPG